MNKTHRSSVLARLALSAGLVLTSAAAHAGGVYWAVNVAAPVQGLGQVGTVVSNTPYGVYVQPAPVVYAPAPVVYAPAPVVYYPPQPVYRAPWWAYERPHHHHHDDDRWRDDDGRGHRGR